MARKRKSTQLIADRPTETLPLSAGVTYVLVQLISGEAVDWRYLALSMVPAVITLITDTKRRRALMARGGECIEDVEKIFAGLDIRPEDDEPAPTKRRRKG